MKPYLNRSNNSGVESYEINEVSITIRFADGSGTYVYDHVTTGRAHVENMKRLAESGLGLATYVNQQIRKRYARKIE